MRIHFQKQNDEKPTASTIKLCVNATFSRAESPSGQCIFIEVKSRDRVPLLEFANVCHNAFFKIDWIISLFNLTRVWISCLPGSMLSLIYRETMQSFKKRKAFLPWTTNVH